MPPLTEIFGGDTPEKPLLLLQVAARTILVYLCGIAVVRIGKSRLLARATGADILVGFILGSLLSRGINGSASLSGTILASAVLVLIHSAVTAAGVRWHKFGNLVKGHAQLLIKDGIVLKDNLSKSHLSEHDLLEALRLNAQTENPAEIKLAYKERNGDISAIKSQ
jgi:uncharacterized membrane protein YcaP (DUF421 family)